MKYTISILVTLLACLSLQAFALRASGGRTVKSESNFFSSLGRIQAGAKDTPRIQLLGSSITGRLPDRAQGFAGVANMGCDGGDAIDVLRAMDQGILPAAPILVIEANTLHLALGGKPSEIGRAMRKPWFVAGLRHSWLAAYARPSAFIYSKLLARRIGGFDVSVGGAGLAVVTRPRIPVARQGEITLSTREEVLVTELTGIFQRLEQRGCHCVFVWLPPARASDDKPGGWIMELALRARIPWWDLGQDAGRDAVVLTDGVHMDAASATKTLKTLLSVIGTDAPVTAGKNCVQ